jgi:triosephosphate isomerase
MRRPLVAGNWKMNHLTQDALAFCEPLPEASERYSDVDAALFATTTLLPTLARALAGTRIRLGGQNCHWEVEGAFTGEVSPSQLADVSCSLVLVGHSERRQLFGETDEATRLKVLAALDAGLEPVLCVGETEEERERGATLDVLGRQLRQALDGIGKDRASRITLAYEPVWAIGTGRTATPEIAQEAHAFLREQFESLYGTATARNCRILYGGSVKPGNLAELLAQDDIDGGLVGGASLEADSFVGLLAAASSLGPRAI